jgi:Polypeptide deformylase
MRPTLDMASAQQLPSAATGTGQLARCLQHETDHLNGVVFGDRLSSRRRRAPFRTHDQVATPLRRKLADHAVRGLVIRLLLEPGRAVLAQVVLPVALGPSTATIT